MRQPDQAYEGTRHGKPNTCPIRSLPRDVSDPHSTSAHHATGRARRRSGYSLTGYMKNPEEVHPFRWAIAAVSTFVVTLGVALFLFALGLIVHESVIWPTATLVTSVVSALLASLLSDWAVRDGTRATTTGVARRSLAWALLPALLILLFPLLVGELRLIWWIGLVAVFTTAMAVYLASRFRGPGEETRRWRASLLWLAGTVVALIAIIFVASLFGLTGA